MSFSVLHPEKLNEIKNRGNNISDLVDEFEKECVLENKFHCKKVKKLFKKFQKLNKIIQSIT